MLYLFIYMQDPGELQEVLLEPRTYHVGERPCLWMEPTNSFNGIEQLELDFLLHIRKHPNR